MQRQRPALHGAIVRAMKMSSYTSRTARFFLIPSLFLITAARLPAPIQEIPESPTPTPAVARASEPKKSPSKPKPKASAEAAAKPQIKASATPAETGTARFAGTWSGTINQGILGDIPFTLVINATATAVKETSALGTVTHTAGSNGNTMTWRAGWLKEIAWTFTPMTDGKTALVTSKSGFGVNGTAIFQKQ
jgi:hypothetical protein